MMRLLAFILNIFLMETMQCCCFWWVFFFLSQKRQLRNRCQVHIYLTIPTPSQSYLLVPVTGPWVGHHRGPDVPRSVPGQVQHPLLQDVLQEVEVGHHVLQHSDIGQGDYHSTAQCTLFSYPEQVNQIFIERESGQQCSVSCCCF